MFVRNQRAVLQNEKGAALLLTMILMVVFSLLTLAMYDLLKTSTQISGNHKRDLRATYIADAGVEEAINLLRNNPYLAVEGYPVVIGPTSFADGTYTTTIKYVAGTLNPTFCAQKDIESTGTLHGSSRTIEVHAKILQIGSANNYAVATTSWKLQ